MLKLITTTTLAAILTASPAMAHVGSHAHVKTYELAAHLLEPDHLLTIAVVVAVLAGLIMFGSRPVPNHLQKSAVHRKE